METDNEAVEELIQYSPYWLHRARGDTAPPDALCRACGVKRLDHGKEGYTRHFFVP